MRNEKAEFGRGINLAEGLFCAKMLIAKLTSNKASFNQLKLITEPGGSCSYTKPGRTLFKQLQGKGGTMEFSDEEKRQIEKVKAKMNCPFDFKCQKDEFASYPKIKPVATLLSCLEEDAKQCGYSLPFGNGFFCKCPLNKFIHNSGSIHQEDRDSNKK
jgi:hypothetical protein